MINICFYMIKILCISANLSLSLLLTERISEMNRRVSGTETKSPLQRTLNHDSAFIRPDAVNAHVLFPNQFHNSPKVYCLIITFFQNLYVKRILFALHVSVCVCVCP